MDKILERGVFYFMVAGSLYLDTGSSIDQKQDALWDLLASKFRPICEEDFDDYLEAMFDICVNFPLEILESNPNVNSKRCNSALITYLERISWVDRKSYLNEVFNQGVNSMSRSDF